MMIAVDSSHPPLKGEVARAARRRGVAGAARLIVEVDSEAHERGDRPARDAARDAWFAARSLLTVRIAVSDVLDDLDPTVRHLVSLAAARTAGEQ